VSNGTNNKHKCTLIHYTASDIKYCTGTVDTYLSIKQQHHYTNGLVTAYSTDK